MIEWVTDVLAQFLKFKDRVLWESRLKSKPFSKREIQADFRLYSKIKS